MPPKAKEVPQVVELKPDTNPWGAFINVLVPSAVLELVGYACSAVRVVMITNDRPCVAYRVLCLATCMEVACHVAQHVLCPQDVPPPKPAEEEPKPKTPAGKTKGAPPPPPPPAEPLPPTIPKTHFTLTYTDAFAPVAGKSSQPDAGQEDKAGAKVQQLTFSYEPLAFRWDTGLAALEQLINANVLLKLHDSVTNNVLASMRLDLLPFAMGKQAFELPAAELAPADVAAEGVLKVSPSRPGCRWPALLQQQRGVALPGLHITQATALAGKFPTAVGGGCFIICLSLPSSVVTAAAVGVHTENPAVSDHARGATTS